MPKGSGRKLYPREGSRKKAGSEYAGRSYREADTRRDAWDEGATQSEVLQLLQVHHVDPTAMRGKQQGTPREICPVPRKGEASRKAS